MASHRRHSARRRTYEILEHGEAGDRVAGAVHWGLTALILISVAAVVLESVPSLEAAYGPVFVAIELAAVAIFTVEYVLRIWCAPEHAPLRHMAPWRARLKLARQPQSIVDLVAILPFYLALFGPAAMRSLLLLRLFRFFKLGRYSPGLASLMEAVHSERRALVACAVILAGTVLISASAMNLAEREVQPESFGTIPDAMYWAVITLTTVGYGDVVPLTPLGRIIAGLTAVAGLTMLALPVGIIASAFSREIHRHDFVVTWSMIARVPLFAELSPADVAGIMRCLHSRSVRAGALIARKGEVAHAMFFIASGEVEVELPGEPVRLGSGDFFGETAVLRRSRLTTTVKAVSSCKLLVLEADDLHHLMNTNPAMAQAIRDVAESRARLGWQDEAG